MTVQKKILDLTGTQYLVQKITGEIPVKISDLQDDVTLGTHIADTDIHVTTADKTTWNTVTSKANDSDVVHKSGNETISGVKTFSDNPLVGNSNTNITISNRQITANGSASTTGNHAYSYMQLQAKVNYADSSSPIDVIVALDINEDAYDDGKKSSLSPSGNNVTNLGKSGKRWANVYGYLANLGGTYVGNEASANERSNLYLLANRDTDGQSGAYIGRFRQNRAQGAMSGGDVSFVSLDFLENSTRYTRCFTMGLTDWDSDGVPQTYYITSPSDKGVLGTSYQQWNKVYAKEYYYGSNNVEFSTKFVTTDTAQTVSGNKTFSSNVNVYNSDNTADTANIILKNSKAERGSTTNIGEQNIFFLDKDNAQIGNIKCEVDSNGYSNLTLQCSDTNDTSSGIQVRKTATGITFQPTSNSQCYLGQSIRKWYSTYTNKINGLEPSSLSLPSDRSARVDISSYITNLGNGDNNQYIVPANGYIWLHFTSINSALCYSQTSGGLTNYAQTFVRYQGDGQLYAFFPVRKNDYFIVQIYTASTAVVQNAFFIPCQGNV